MSSAPADGNAYTPLHTTGDLVGLLDTLSITSAVLVGHDWGATHAWNAALLRPDVAMPLPRPAAGPPARWYLPLGQAF